MPNWVYNNITVVAPDAEAIAKVKDALQGEEGPLDFNRIIPRPADKEDDWYNWNIANWGCKWNASDIQVAQEDHPQLSYHFSTPWSPPIPVVGALSRQHPATTIVLVYEEEQGWGGELRFQNGNATTLREWDVPSSHAEIVERGGNCYCEHGTHAYFPDCFAAQAREYEKENPGSIDAKMFEFINVLGVEWQGDLESLIAASRAINVDASRPHGL